MKVRIRHSGLRSWRARDGRGIRGRPCAEALEGRHLMAGGLTGPDLRHAHGIPPITPVADAGPDRAAEEGRTITFQGRAAGGVHPSYLWDFGDGTTAAGTLSPQHAYRDNGTYTATLTVTDVLGRAYDTAVVTVANVAPVVSVAAGPFAVPPGQPVTLTAAASDPGPADAAAGFTFTWDFGDGGRSSGLNLTAPSHAYAAPGTYTVLVTAADKDGAAGAATTVVTVTGPPLGGVAVTAGWATFGQALPQGAAAAGLQLGTLVTQVDVKTRWPDGSIKFAVVSANVPADGTYTLRPAAAPSVGTFAPLLPDAAVRLTIGGTVYTAPLPRTASGDAWLSGPLAREARATVVPAAPDGTRHPFLDVVFDTRSYVDGKTRLDVTVENVLDKAGATKVDYSVDIVASGATLYHHDPLTHFYMTRWREVFDLGGLVESRAIPDLESFSRAGAVPRYLNAVTNAVSSPTGTYPANYPYPVAGQPKFDILQGGDLLPNMTEHGGRQEIAPYPDWAARYLVHRDPIQQQYVLAHGDLSGSWPVHLREPEGGAYRGLGGGRLVSIDERPNFWWDSGTAGSYPWTLVNGVWTPGTATQRGDALQRPAGSPGPGQPRLLVSGQRPPAVAGLHPLPADRRPLLCRRSGRLGRLRPAVDLPGRVLRPPRRQPGAALRQRDARLRLDPAEPGRRSGLPARCRAGQGVLRRRRSATTWPGSTPRRQTGVGPLGVAWLTDARRVAGRRQDRRGAVGAHLPGLGHRPGQTSRASPAARCGGTRWRGSNCAASPAPTTGGPTRSRTSWPSPTRRRRARSTTRPWGRSSPRPTRRRPSRRRRWRG